MAELKDAMSLNDKIEKIHERFFKLKYREGTVSAELLFICSSIKRSCHWRS